MPKLRVLLHESLFLLHRGAIGQIVAVEDGPEDEGDKKAMYRRDALRLRYDIPDFLRRGGDARHDVCTNLVKKF